MCLFLGNVIIGYSVCWPAPILSKLKDPKQSPLIHQLTGTQMAWVVSAFQLGAVTGSQFSAFLSNAIGRKPTLLLSALLCLSSSIIRVLASNAPTMIVGRFVSGFGVGGVACGNVVYIGEIASTNLRGIMLTVTGILHTLGCLLVFSVGPYVSFATVEYIPIVMGVLHVTSLFWIVESPVYHVIKGDKEAAKNTLIYLGRSKDIDKELETMIQDVKERKIQYSQLNSKTTLPKWMCSDIFRRRRNRRAFMITTILLDNY